MRSAFAHNFYLEREQRLMFVETPDKQEVQIPSTETAEANQKQSEAPELRGTDKQSLEAATQQAQETADKALTKLEADLQKTQHEDGSTTLGLNLRITIPGATKILDLLSRFTSKEKQEQPQQEEPQAEAPKNDEETTQQSTEAAPSTPEEKESVESQLKQALELIQKQQEQIDRLTKLLEDQQKQKTEKPSTEERSSSGQDNSQRQEAAPAVTEQREEILSPREQLVRSAKDAMNSDGELSSDMGKLYKFFESKQNAMPQTYEQLEDTQPDMYYTMALASAKINKFAFDVSKLNPKIVSDGRRSIQATPQGTYQFMKEVMMSSGSGMTRAPDVVSNAVRNKASGTPQSSRVEAPTTNGSPQPAETPDTPPVANAPEAPAVREEVPAPSPAVPEEAKEGLSAESLQGLKNALGTLADTVAMQSDGNATIDLSNAIKNPVAKDGMTFILDALQIQHENGKIAVTPQNIAAITTAIGKAVDYAQKLNSGNLADLPPEVSQKILDAIDKQLPENMRGRLKLENANIVLDAGKALDGRLAKFAVARANLEVKDGKVVIQPKDIAKAVALLTALSGFFLERQEA